MYAVYFKGVATGKQYKTLKSVNNAVNKMDLAYGACAYSYRFI